MVFDIDFGTERGCTMFDIEIYQRESEHERTKGLWSSEIHVLPCVEGITRFLESKRNDNTFDYDEGSGIVIPKSSRFTPNFSGQIIAADQNSGSCFGGAVGKAHNSNFKGICVNSIIFP